MAWRSAAEPEGRRGAKAEGTNRMIRDVPVDMLRMRTAASASSTYAPWGPLLPEDAEEGSARHEFDIRQLLATTSLRGVIFLVDVPREQRPPIWSELHSRVSELMA